MALRTLHPPQHIYDKSPSKAIFSLLRVRLACIASRRPCPHGRFGSVVDYPVYSGGESALSSVL